jgi:excisionase family DNA binding protein
MVARLARIEEKLDQLLADRKPGRATAREMLSVEEAAGALNLGRTKVYGLVRRGELFSIKEGGRRLVPRSAIQAFIFARMERAEAEAPTPRPIIVARVERRVARRTARREGA